MKRILLSLATIGATFGVVVYATGAFFSDTEISENNVLQAGSVDLKIDSDCHYFHLTGFDEQTDEPIYEDVGCTHEVFNEQTQEFETVSFGTWDETDLTTEQFFWFEDLKPGDWGENTISIHVLDNDAWGRMFLANVEDIDNTCTEPENDTVDGEDGACSDPDGDGELDEFMEAVLWLDQGNTPGFQCSEEPEDGPCDADEGEGDNIWQGLSAEPVITESVDDEFSVPFSGLLSSTYDTFLGSFANSEEANEAGLYEDGRMRGSITYYIGVAWCFGDSDLQTFGTDSFFCDGSVVDNTPQTDILSGDVGFEVEQHRNNPEDPFSTI